MTTSPPNDRSRLRKAVPIAFSIVFVLITVLAIWRPPLLFGGGGGGGGGGVGGGVGGDPPPPACGAQPGDQVPIADGVLKIGTVFPQTGSEGGTTGAPLAAATRLAVDDVNEAGGIPGLPSPQVDLVADLDEGDPGSPAACASASRLLSDGVDVIAGPYASTSTLAIYQRVTKAGRLLVSPSNTLPALSTVADQDLYFRTAPSDQLQAKVLADLIVQEGGKNVAVVADEDPFSSSLAQAVTEQLKNSGVTSDLLTFADRSAFPGIAGKVAAGAFDGVVLVGFRDIAELAGVLSQRGVNPQNHRFYGSTGLLQNTASGGLPPGALAGLRGFVPWALPDFNGRLKAVQPSLQDLTYAAQAYDAVVAVSLAAAAGRTDDPRGIARELRQVTRDGQKCDSYQACVNILRQNPAADIDYDGVSGPLGFTPQGDVCQGLYNLSAFGPTGFLDQAIRGGLFSPDLCR